MRKRNKFFIAASLAILLLGGLSACKKESKETNGTITDIPEELTPTPTQMEVISPEASIPPQNTITPESTETPENTITPEATVTPSVTEPPLEPTVTEEVSPQPSATPTPEAKAALTTEQAQQAVRTAITDKKYEINIQKDRLSLEGREYFLCNILEKGRTLEPSILIDTEDGTLYFYDQDGVVSDFTKFPLDNVEIADGGEEQFTETQAVEKLKEFNTDTLKLKRSLDEYEIEIDTWTTMVNGKECYGINVFDPKLEGRPLAGIYYVALDNTAVYTVDEDNNFIKISGSETHSF